MSLTTINELIVTTLEPFTETFGNILNDENSTEANCFGTEANVTDTNATHPIIKHKALFKIYDVIIPLIGTFIIITNGIVLVSSGLILKRGVQPKTTYLFLGNIAMADLVTGLTTVGAELYPKELRGVLTCHIILGLIVSSTLTSVMSVGLIGIDRFLYIVHGMKYQKWLTTYRARWLIVGSWLLCLIVGFLPGMGWVGETYVKRCWFILIAPPELIMLTVAVGIMPMILIVVLYSIILYHAIRKVMQLHRADTDASRGHAATSKSETHQMRIFRGGTSKANQEAKKASSTKKTKAILIVALTAGSFVITWFPFFIACQIYAFCVIKHGNTDKCLSVGAPTATILPAVGFFNSLLNPIIYAWWHKGFRGFICNRLMKKIKHTSTTKSNSSAKTSSTCTSSTKGSKRSYTMSQKSNNSQNSESALHCLQEVELQPAAHGKATAATVEEAAEKKTNVRLIEGPFIGDNEDTHL